MIESALEATMAMQLRATGIDMMREYKFHPVRKWRFDFTLPDIRLALEVRWNMEWWKTHYGRRVYG